MKHAFAALALTAGLLAAAAQATTHRAAPDMPDAAAKPPTAQQNKMTSCNKDAEGMAGDARKAFMKECLSAKPATPQDRMKTCNRDAEGKTGDERKAFMKTCLSAKS